MMPQEEAKFEDRRFNEADYASENVKWMERMEQDLDYFKSIDANPKKPKEKPYTVTNELDRIEEHIKTVKRNKQSKTPPKSRQKGRITKPTLKSARTLNQKEPKAVSKAATQPVKQAEGYPEIRGLTEEIEAIKRMYKELKQRSEEHCVMFNERRQFEKLKNDFIKLNADNQIVRQDMAEMTEQVDELNKRVAFLEEENKYLRKLNRNEARYFGADELPEAVHQPERLAEERLADRVPVGMSTSTAEMNKIVQSERRRYYLIPKGD